MMIGFGLLTMLIVLGLPILLVVGLIALVARRPTPLSPPYQGVSGPVTPPAQGGGGGRPIARYCSHCGYGLQAGWSNCPNCGAPTGGN
ncbi:MAG: hypothetical protein HY260_05775 [Chloroflexi bacterium]|nr:hypothetical protein [Chloroflexota bacterium]